MATQCPPFPFCSKRSWLKGFTVTELLVVSALISVLLALAFPVFTTYRQRSALATCAANLRQLGAATFLYAGEHKNTLPFITYLTADGSLGSGAVTGTWYYNLAPYLGVPRTESTKAADVERTYLGQPTARIGSPCVFTCPAHSKKETNSHWKPTPMTWPSEVPVSYAPSHRITQEELSYVNSSGYIIYPYHLYRVTAPSQKIWLSDSPVPARLNVSNSRWSPNSGVDHNFPYQGFTRHNKGGNALFFDGHVKWLPISTFVTLDDTPIDNVIRLYFDPNRFPAQDL